MTEPPIRVLIVDDSAFARRVMRELLSGDERLQVVGYACDGIDALEKIAELDPEVLTLDLVMPELDGAGLLEALKERVRPPFAVVVSSTAAESDLGVSALEAGAFEVVHKPTALATDRLYELGAELLRKVVSAGVARRADKEVPRPSLSPPTALQKPEVIVIGASTGGPKAVSDLILALPLSFCIPIAVVLHMPAGYTDAFALRLDQRSHLRVYEARDGETLSRGHAAIARAGSHLVLSKEKGPDSSAITMRFSAEPSNGLHRPSVNQLFQSAAGCVGPRVLAIVLTGMGDDGSEGCGHVKKAGGYVIVEDASTCVVHGMPRAVKEAGFSDLELPLPQIASALSEFAG